MSRKDLSNDIWRAYDIMRRDDGTTGILQYMEQISWMMFLKVFEDIEDRLENEALFEGEEYQRVIDEGYRWSEWSKKAAKENEIIKFVDETLFPYLRKLKGTPQKEIVSSIFNEIKGNQMKSAFNFKDVVDIVDEIDFNDPKDSHTISKLYEESLVKLGKEGGIAGEFYTPRPIVRLIVKMVNPSIEDQIFDPFCGSCGFIVESYKHIKQQNVIGVEEYDKLQSKAFCGHEKKPIAHLMGIMNCMLHGLITPDIRRKNSLEANNRNISENERYSVIMTNPPFGGSENKQIQQNFAIQSMATELLALQYVMKHLMPGGRCAIVVPEGILSRGEAFARVKEELLTPENNYNVHTIISLPAGVFANVTSSGQGPKTNIMCFDKNGPTREVWYYELVPDRAFSKARPVSDDDLKDCWNKWKRREISENSWIVDVHEIIKNEYDLTAKNPNKSKQTVNQVPIGKIIADISNKEEQIQSILKQIEEELAENIG